METAVQRRFEYTVDKVAQLVDMLQAPLHDHSDVSEEVAELWKVVRGAWVERLRTRYEGPLRMASVSAEQAPPPPPRSPPQHAVFFQHVNLAGGLPTKTAARCPQGFPDALLSSNPHRFYQTDPNDNNTNRVPEQTQILRNPLGAIWGTEGGGGGGQLDGGWDFDDSDTPISSSDISDADIDILNDEASPAPPQNDAIIDSVPVEEDPDAEEERVLCMEEIAGGATPRVVVYGLCDEFKPFAYRFLTTEEAPPYPVEQVAHWVTPLEVGGYVEQGNRVSAFDTCKVAFDSGPAMRTLFRNKIRAGRAIPPLERSALPDFCSKPTAENTNP